MYLSENSHPVRESQQNLVAVKFGGCKKGSMANHYTRVFILIFIQILGYIVLLTYVCKFMANERSICQKLQTQFQRLNSSEKFRSILKQDIVNYKNCSATNLRSSATHINLLHFENIQNYFSTLLTEETQNHAIIINFQRHVQQLKENNNQADYTNDTLHVLEDICEYFTDMLHYFAINITDVTPNIWREMISYLCVEKSIISFNIAAICGQLHLCCDCCTYQGQVSYLKHIAIGREFLILSGEVLNWIKPILNKIFIEDKSTFQLFFKQQQYFQSTSEFNLTSKDVTQYRQSLEQLENRLLPLLEEIRLSMIQIINKFSSENVTNYLIAVVFLASLLVANLILLVFARNISSNIDTFVNNLVLTARRLRLERDDSDCLLDRMLPEPVSRQLKQKKEVVAENFECVTVCFSDIVGFTKLSFQSTPMQVITLLNELYNMFDTCVEMYDAYKVETIGDAYMIASGLPLRNGNKHAKEIANVALEIMHKTVVFEIPHQTDKRLSIRMGIHTGPCVAGVVGSKMPRYCLFGDTINTASRMESTSEAGRIHITECTKDYLDIFGDYEIQPRSAVDVKGKGLMFTFWLVGKRTRDIF